MPTKNRTMKITIALGCLLLLGQSVTQAQVLTFALYQAGYAEGATITGSFSGTDLNGDGQLISFHSEVTDFNLTFSGNSLVPAFSHTLANLTGLAYEIGTPFIADGNLLPYGEGITSSSTVPGAGYGYFAFSSGYRVFANAGSPSQVSSTNQLLAVSTVPEQSSVLLAFLGTMSVLAFAAAKRAA